MEKHEYEFYENTKWNAIVSVARALPGRASRLNDKIHIQQHKTWPETYLTGTSKVLHHRRALPGLCLSSLFYIALFNCYGSDHAVFTSQSYQPIIKNLRQDIEH
jgi:hypothetical protein